MLTIGASDSSFLLEGMEDLDEFNSSRQLSVVIQVKNLNRPLVLSDILSIEGTSFVKCFFSIVKTSPSAKAVLVTFSAPGNDLATLMESKQIGPLDKPVIRKYELKESDWLTFKQRTTLLKVDEITLIQDILQSLKITWPAVYPLPTADILLQWLASCAEKQITINSKMLYEKVDSIAVYLSERIAASVQLGKYLMPLAVERPKDAGTLVEEFYKGVSVDIPVCLTMLFRAHQSNW